MGACVAACSFAYHYRLLLCYLVNPDARTDVFDFQLREERVHLQWSPWTVRMPHNRIHLTVSLIEPPWRSEL